MRRYAYGIRYNYGLEGKRVNWSPHSCMKIINETGTNAAAGEHHGCPFKTFDEGQLRAQLQQMGVASSETSFILDKARDTTAWQALLHVARRAPPRARVGVAGRRPSAASLPVLRRRVPILSAHLSVARAPPGAASPAPAGAWAPLPGRVW